MRGKVPALCEASQAKPLFRARVRNQRGHRREFREGFRRSVSRLQPLSLPTTLTRRQTQKNGYQQRRRRQSGFLFYNVSVPLTPTLSRGRGRIVWRRSCNSAIVHGRERRRASQAQGSL